MSTKKMLIVGNNQEFITEISFFVQTNFKNEIKIIGSANSVKAACKILKHDIPDLLLLDFCFNDGSALDILSSSNLIARENSILFLNTNDENLVQLLQENSYQYFVKPIDINSLIDLISDLLKKDSKSNEEILNKEKLETVHSSGLRNRIFIQCQSLDVYKIIRCEINDNCLSFFTTDSKVYKCVNTLTWAENYLSKSDYNFIRVHNKHLINVDYIKSYSNNNHFKVRMIDKSEIPVSNRKRNTISKIIKNQGNLIKSILIMISSQLPLLISELFLDASGTI